MPSPDHRETPGANGAGPPPAGTSGASLVGADFDDARLAGADFAGVDASHASFRRADLTGADFSDAVLAGTSFASATMTGACLAGADLTNADFADADLTDASLANARLAGAEFAGARLVRVDFGGLTDAPGIAFASDLSGTDLSEMTDLRPSFREWCRDNGATGISGFACPECVSWDVVTSGLNPDCHTCGGDGMVPWDPDLARQSRPIVCPWCRGDGWFSSMPGISWGCPVCNGLGRAERWSVNRMAVWSTFGWGDGTSYMEGLDPEISVRDVDFTAEDFADGEIARARFADCPFTGATFLRATVRDVTFAGCAMRDVDLRSATLSRVRFEGCDLTGSDWLVASCDDVVVAGETTGGTALPHIAGLRRVRGDDA